MPDQNRNVNILIKARDEASAALSNLVGAINPVTIALAAAAAAAAAAVTTLVAATKAASEQEQADVRLAVALASIGENTAKGRAGMSAFIDSLEDATKVSDETIAKTISLLAQFGRLGGNDLKRATQAVIEYSAAIGTDATAAAEQLVNVLVRGSGRLAGINTRFDEGASKADKFASVLSQMEKVGGNTAEALGSTFTGALEQVSIEWERVLETAGAAIVQNAAAREAIDTLGKIIKQTGEFIEEHRAAFEGLVTLISKVATAALEAAPKVARFLGFVLTMGQLDAVIDALDQLGKTFGAVAGAAVDVPAKVGNIKVTLEGIPGVAGEAKKALVELATTPLPPLEELDALLEAIGVQTMRDLAEETKRVDDALAELAAQHASGAISDEVYDRILADIIQITGQLPTWTDNLNKAADAADDLRAHLLTVGETFKVSVIDATLKVSDALVETAFGAKRSWGEFFKQLMEDIAKAILRMAILQALSGAGGWWGQALTLFLGGAPGRRSPGPSPEIAPILPASISLAPAGSAFGPEALGLMAGRNTEPGSGPGLGGALQMFNQIVPLRDRESEIADLISDISTAVERRGFHLVASRVITT